MPPPSIAYFKSLQNIKCSMDQVTITKTARRYKPFNFLLPGGYVPRFPDPRDFRLAIVDEPPGILIKIEFLSPALNSVCVRVRLLLGIGLDFWPCSTDFPARIPLGHPDCFLFYKAAQTGCFLVGFGVQSSAWQLRVPAAEYMILNDYSANSTVHSILDLLLDALEEIHSFSNSRKLQVITCSHQC